MAWGLGEGDGCLFCGDSVRSETIQSCQTDPFRKWSFDCTETLFCLFSLKEPHPVRDILRRKGISESFCRECLQRVRDIDFTVRELHRVLQTLEHQQKEVLNKLKLKNARRTLDGDGSAEFEEDDVKPIVVAVSAGELAEDIRTASVTVNVALDQLRHAMNLGALENRSFVPEFFDDDHKIENVNVRTSRSRMVQKRKVYFSENSGSGNDESDDAMSNGFLPTVDDDEDLEDYHDDDNDPDFKIESKNFAQPDDITPSTSNNSKKETEDEEDEELGSDLDNELELDVFPCTFQKCCQTFTTEERLQAHVRQVHEFDPEPFHCWKCPSKFRIKKTLQYHLDSHHQIRDTRFFFSVAKLKEERRKLRKEKKNQSVFSKDDTTTMTEQTDNNVAEVFSAYLCVFCTLGFQNEEEKNTHEEWHMNIDQPFKCSVCESVFSNSMNLIRHVESTHAPRKVLCDICGTQFKTVSSLEKHRLIHSDSFVGHKCDICGHVARSKATLDIHMYGHSGTRSFVCETCGKSFVYKKGLIRHIRNHTGDFPFACKVCGKRFSESSMCKKHEEIHSGTYLYQCSMCPKMFRSTPNLHQHEKTHLPKDPNRKPRVRAPKPKETPDVDP